MSDESVENIIRQWPCPNNCENGAIPHGSLGGEGLDWSECQFCHERDEVVHRVRELETEARIAGKALEEAEAALEECRGDGLAGDPSKWPHKDQIEGLGLQLKTEREARAKADDALWAMRGIAAAEARSHGKTLAKLDKAEAEVEWLREALRKIISWGTSADPSKLNMIEKIALKAFNEGSDRAEGSE